MEVRQMPYAWPEDTDFAQWELDVLDRACPVCQRRMYICDYRYRHFHTLEGPVELVCKLNHCPDPTCPGHSHTKSPEIEITIAPPKWAIAWDVLCWIGHRRCSRHWSIPQIQGELQDTYRISLSTDSLVRYLRYYQVLLTARQSDPAALRQYYQGVEGLILSIDGLQPEKGHETLYVVRELTQKRVWFAEPLLSATAEEVRRLIAQAKAWAEGLGKPVVLWLSDRQEAFVTGIAAEFPQVPHRYCANHFLRDLAKPVLEADSQAKVQMRKKVRGLRKIEQAVLKRRSATALASLAVAEPEASRAAPVGATDTPAAVAEAASLAVAEPEASVAAPVGPTDTPAPVPQAEAASDVVLDYCAAVRGILNDDQGGPLHPPGLRMAAALGEVRESLQRNLDEKKGGSPRSNSAAWPTASTAAWTPSARNKKRCGPMSKTSRK
jgi:hypothetical protein